MNALLIVILIFAAWKGWSKGLIMAVFSMVGLLLGIMAAYKFSAVVALYLRESAGWEGAWVPLVAFLIVLALVSILVNLLGKMVESAAGATLLGPANKLAGTMMYLVLYAFLISAVMYFGIKAGWMNPPEDGIAAMLAPLAPALIDKAGSLLPFFQDITRDLEDYFKGL